MKHLIFDLDGTLVDSYQGLSYSVIAAIKHVYPNLVMAEDVRIPIGPRIRELIQLILGNIPEPELNQLEMKFRQIYDGKGWQKFSIYENVVQTLRTLSTERKVALYIVTNKPQLPTEKILHHTGIDTLFTEVVCPDSRQYRFENKSTSLTYLVNKYHIKKKEVFYVGDTQEDWNASLKSQIEFVGAQYGYGTFSEINMNHLTVIKNFQDLLLL